MMGIVTICIGSSDKISWIQENCVYTVVMGIVIVPRTSRVHYWCFGIEYIPLTPISGIGSYFLLRYYLYIEHVVTSVGKYHPFPTNIDIAAIIALFMLNLCSEYLSVFCEEIYRLFSRPWTWREWWRTTPVIVAGIRFDRRVKFKLDNDLDGLGAWRPSSHPIASHSHLQGHLQWITSSLSSLATTIIPSQRSDSLFIFRSCPPHLLNEVSMDHQVPELLNSCHCPKINFLPNRKDVQDMTQTQMRSTTHTHELRHTKIFKEQWHTVIFKCTSSPHHVINVTFLENSPFP